MAELKKDYLDGERQMGQGLGQPMVNHSVHPMPQSYEMHSAEKLKSNTGATISTNPSLTQSGHREPEQKRRGHHMQTPLSELSLINPLLYKPASKPPTIKEGDWLCPDPTCCNINWAKRIYCNRCGIKRPNIDKIRGKTYMITKLHEDESWSCNHCQNINRASRARCSRCGEFRTEE